MKLIAAPSAMYDGGKILPPVSYNESESYLRKGVGVWVGKTGDVGVGVGVLVGGLVNITAESTVAACLCLLSTDHLYVLTALFTLSKVLTEFFYVSLYTYRGIRFKRHHTSNRLTLCKQTNFLTRLFIQRKYSMFLCVR